MEFVDIFDNLLESREDREATVIGVLAIENIESDDGFGTTFFEIAVSHGNFVEIGEEGDAALIETGNRHGSRGERGDQRVKTGMLFSER